MLCKLFIVFTLVSHAISDSCVRYTFEENYNDWSENQWGSLCDQYPFWTTGKYSDLDLTGQNERSTSFITPLVSWRFSCVSSFIFTMNGGGTIEVNIYMEARRVTDQIVTLAHLLYEDGDIQVAHAFNRRMDLDFVAGWHTLKMTLTGPRSYKGFISILGTASRNSTILVDSFRYIPPGMDESECQLYENLPDVKNPRFNSFRG